MSCYPKGVNIMKQAENHTPELCIKFHQASELIGRRWNGAIIYVLLQQTCRFAALRAAIPDITDRMLSERLQELEDEGVVARQVIPETPVRVEYSLTKKGKALAEPIGSIANWAEKYMEVAEETQKAPRTAAR